MIFIDGVPQKSRWRNIVERFVMETEKLLAEGAAAKEKEPELVYYYAIVLFADC
jgi:hypothetical protein